MKDCCQPSSTCLTETPVRVIALVGNPNCGKTTLFNAITGAKQRVGNWPGVTVERKCGSFTTDQQVIEVMDLPGVYSLTQISAGGAVDERIACDYILKQQADVVVNVVDASNLERHLYLTTQLLEMGVPLIVALNMMDVAAVKHIDIDVSALAQRLGCQVIVLSAHKKSGVEALKQAVIHYQTAAKKEIPWAYPEVIQEALQALAAQIALDDQKRDARFNQLLALRLLEDDLFAQQMVTPELIAQAKNWQQRISEKSGEDADILLADARYQFIHALMQVCITRKSCNHVSWTTRIDNIVLNRVLGVPIFLAVMYLLFLFSINIGGAFQDFFDISSQTIFVDGLAYGLSQLGSPTWLTALLANGLGKGVNTTITFIPVIGSMFLFLAFLEDSGYMARAAFVIDRLMRLVGLPGKAFVPMIVGFGCNVPAVMGARTLENKRDRILTIMMSPFMSCGARLAIFAVFTAAFFPRGGQNIVFALYLIGILMAVFTGFILRKTVLKGDPSPLVMELPAYHLPRMKTLLLHAWQRLKGFVFRAGKLIVPICVLIGALNSLNMDGSINTGEGDMHSLLSQVGQWVTPLFTPMGIHADNWPATVGLVTGVLAKEVVVGSLNTLYSQMGHFSAQGSESAFHLWAGLQEALRSIPQNFAELSSALVNPIAAKAPAHALNQGVYGLMYQKFDGPVGAFAYLLFVLLYFPCISTTAVMLRELHRGWSIFSIFWMTGVAYGTAVAFYQAATFFSHPLSSAAWLVGVTTVFIGTLLAIREYANQLGQRATFNASLGRV